MLSGGYFITDVSVKAGTNPAIYLEHSISFIASRPSEYALAKKRIPQLNGVQKRTIVSGAGRMPSIISRHGKTRWARLMNFFVSGSYLHLLVNTAYGVSPPGQGESKTMVFRIARSAVNFVK